MNYANDKLNRAGKKTLLTRLVVKLGPIVNCEM